MALAAIAASQAAPAQTAAQYPVKPVRVIVSASAGALTDTQARLFSQILSEAFRQQFVTDNRPGAGGAIGFRTVAGAAPDGYTLLAASPSLTTVYAFQDKPGFDPARDFAPVSLVFRAPYLIVANPSLPAKSMADLIELARTKPDTVTFGLGGTGSIQHLAAAWITTATKTRMILVAYKGLAPALIDVMSGQIQTTMGNAANVAPHTRSGKLRALAVTSRERSPVFPELRTVAESGVSGFDVTSWQGWLAPAGTPSAIVDKLNAALARAVRTPEIAEKLKADGALPVGSTPLEFRQVVASEAQRWRSLVKTMGVSGDVQ